MQDKGSTNKKPSYTYETVYYMDTVDGREHQITEENYEELKHHIFKLELYGIFIANEKTDNEIVVTMRNVVKIRKFRREEEA